MSLTLSELLDKLRRAASPEEVFGRIVGEPQVELRQRYRALVAVAHPDHNPRRAAEAHEAFLALRQWYAAAQRLVERGCYGVAPRLTIATPLHRYVAYAGPLPGDLCDLYPSETPDGPVLVKIARSPRNRDLLQAEARAMRQIARALDGQPVRAHFPILVEHTRVRDAAGGERAINILRAEEGYVTLSDVLLAYPRGIELADAAWMFNRMLAALGVAHNLGLVHGAVTLAHVLVRPDDHNGMLLDWCYSVVPGEPLKAISPAYAVDYPPEVRARQPATPATDLYMAARCMVRLLGSDEPEALPPRVPRAVRALLRACLLPAPARRYGDAWQLLDDFQQILGELYGPPRFRPFQLPQAAF